MKRNGLFALAVALLLLAVAGTACAQTDAVLYIGTQVRALSSTKSPCPMS